MASSYPSPLAPMLMTLERRAKLNDAERAAILDLPHTVRAMRAREHIVREGDEPLHACVLLSGFAMRHKVAGSGARQILSIHTIGALVDLANSMLSIADHNIEAVTAVNAAYIPIGAVTMLAADHPAVGRAMWRETLVEAAIFREWILNVGRRDARSRVAHLICELAIRFQPETGATPDHLDWPFTQEQVGDMVGLTSVHVNRTLMKLQVEGMLDRGHRAMRILDWHRLVGIADFDPTYLHMDDRSDR